MLSLNSDGVLHISLNKNNAHKEKFYIRCIGFDCVDWDENYPYYSEEELPTWLKQKMSVLMALPVGDEIKTVGKHVSEGVFWVYKEDEEWKPKNPTE